ncbi:MAG: MauE/DoxX family redox-associated membrane protein [Bacteroidota bacterium]
MSNKKEWIIEIISALFVVLFIYAAVSKVMDYDKFRLQIGQSPVLTTFAGTIVWLVPAIEVVIAMLLMTKRFRLTGLYASFSLMVMFTAYIIVITRLSEYVPCSCGGVLEKLSWDEHMVFNIGFVLLASIAIVIYPKDILLQWKQDNAENLEESRHNVKI